ncbi:hypothetical protein Tco_0715511 [Tanacetum coccineum]
MFASSGRAFACSTSFPWNTSKSASKDPFPKPSQYNTEHYATLVAYPAPFHKYPEPFLCLIGISRNYTLDEDTYPQFLRDNDEGGVGERQRAEGKPKLLDTTVGRVVLILPVAPARALSELEASVEKLFDEGGSSSHTERGDSVSGGHGVDILQVSVTAKLKEDHGTSTGPSVASKSKSALQRLLTRAVLNLEVGVATLPTLPFITSSVSVTPEREDGNQSDFMLRWLLWLTGSDFIVGGIRTVVSPDTDLQKVYIPQWSVTNGSRLDDGRAARQMSLSAEVRMRAEFNIREKRRLCSLVEEKDSLLKARDEENLKSERRYSCFVKETKAERPSISV